MLPVFFNVKASEIIGILTEWYFIYLESKLQQKLNETGSTKFSGEFAKAKTLHIYIYI